MLRTILITVIFVFFTLNVFCQSSSLRVGIGIKPIVSSVHDTDPDLNLDPFNALSLGAAVDYKLSNKLLLSSGLEYEKKGARGETLIFNDQGFSTGASPYRFNLNFLQLPLYVTYRSNGKFKFYASLGCNLGYLFNQELAHDDNAFPDSETNFNEFELSLLLGGGIEFSYNERFDLSLGLRNNRALTELESENGFLGLKTDTFGAILGLHYNL